METVVGQAPTIPIPDQFFWYIFASVLAIILSRMIWKWGTNLEKMLSDHSTELVKLSTNDKIQDLRLDNIEEGVVAETNHNVSERLAEKIVAKLRAVTPPNS